MNIIRTLIVDDHEIVRYGIARLLEKENDLCVVGEAKNGNEAVELFHSLQPNVCLMDIDLPGMDGLQATRSILSAKPDARILIYTMYQTQQYIDEALCAGACGFIVKTDQNQELIEGLRVADSGKWVFSSNISRMMRERYIAHARNIHKPVHQDQKKSVLTEREKQILGMIAQGLTSYEIADQLFISPRTVDTHRYNLMHKLNVKNTAGLVRYAMEHRSLLKQIPATSR